MKKLSLSSALFLAAIVSATPIWAQDAADWSGAYAGLFASTVSSDIGVEDIDGIGVGFSIDDIAASGTEIGGLVGYSFQRGSMVYGVELSVATGGASGNSIVDATSLDETLEWQTKSTAAVSARVGRLVGKTLYFGSAGLARAEAKFGYLNYADDLVTVESDSRIESTFNGYTLGLGMERLVGAKMTLRAEILHSRFSSQILEIAPGIAPFEYSPSNTSLRAGLTFRF